MTDESDGRCEGPSMRRVWRRPEIITPSVRDTAKLNNSPADTSTAYPNPSLIYGPS